LLSDEFTYLLRTEPAIGSVFQKVWDHRQHAHMTNGSIVKGIWSSVSSIISSISVVSFPDLTNLPDVILVSCNLSVR
jgi:hypothetical protein